MEPLACSNQPLTCSEELVDEEKPDEDPGMKSYYSVKDNNGNVVASADVCKYDVGKRGHMITRLETLDPGETGKGLGGQLLKQILDHADKTGSTLWLEPSPLSHQSMEAGPLNEWYARNGFEGGWGSMMRRKPKKQNL